ncbi:MAG: single-stranded-DNA-specific exonuclease RecJ, partial [Chloroflexi bacterium]|nr:single-stranded-DNA-specific exonuclease RecJ [Chloroflexota bacterium]
MQTIPSPDPGGRKVWRIRTPLPQEARRTLGQYPPFMAQVMYNRGLRSLSQAQAFLSGNPVSHDPFALPSMETAVQRLHKALQMHETVAVFGDFDVDGISATALLATALRPFGCQVIPYIPHRSEEGHGLSIQAVQQLAAQGVRLLITVDNGISSYDEIAAAAEAGMDTIVTDHHLPPHRIPPALAIVDPRLPSSRYPFPDLTGAGLALKLAQGLHQVARLPTVGHLPTLNALASLGTIADVAPLLDENRSIVQLGLSAITHSPSPGLAALLRIARLEGRPIDTEAVGWMLAPRLNAAGRIDSAADSYRLLVTQSPEEALGLAQSLEQQNRLRQEMTETAYQQAKASLTVGAQEPALSLPKGLAPLLMISDRSFSVGVIGLVAGRLAEEFGRPAVVVSQGQEFSRGSCRSVPWFNIGQALYQVDGEVGGFVRHGGHAQAAGFTIATERLPLLGQALVRLAQESLDTGGEGGQEAPALPAIDVDMEMSLGAIPRDIYRWLQALAPFGPGNSEPVFLSRGVQIADVRPLG